MSLSRLGMPALAARWAWLGTAGAGVALALSGCANENIKRHYAHGREYFSEAKYGHASPKVVADGQPVPKGGGQYLVGHPYTIAGHTYYPSENESYSAVGLASWYGAAFHGRRTANGEVYDMASLTAAHPTLPLPCYARVTNTSNGYSVIVRVNDRGPYHAGRVMDVSSRTADVLGFKGDGTARIKVEYVGRAPLEGSDDRMLLASLRTDGSPANLNGYASPVMVAGESEPGTSIFAALFGSGRSAEPAYRPAPPPPPQPEPEPIRVAAAPPPPPEPIREARAVTVAVRQPHGPVPLPPARPFDLGAAHGPAGVAVAVHLQPKPAPIAVLPPRRPLVQASAEKALYFSDPSADRVKRVIHSAFDRLTPAKGPAAEE
jgi:rare lipoprotein A